MNPAVRPSGVPSARPPRSQRHLRIELLCLYLGALSGVLLVFGAVVREGFRSIAMADAHSELGLIAKDLAEDIDPPPLPGHGREQNGGAGAKDFARAHQQVEWFSGEDTHPYARFGEQRTLGPLPPPVPGEPIRWQEQSDAIAIVVPVDAPARAPSDRPRVWLRVSQGLEPLQARIRQLDLALAGAIVLAMLLSAISAGLLARRVVEPLERRLKQLRDFGLDASHELRGPLAALAANADMGLLDCPPGDHPQRRRFAAIASATEQMQGLVEDLLQLARQEQAPLQSLQRLALSDLVEQQLTLYGDAMALRQQDLQRDLQPDVAVIGQATLLSQLVRNLLDNAHRHCPPGSQIRVRLWRTGRQACLELQDDGPGIAPDQLPRVFDRFWRASTDRSDGGNGMGLAIAARITEAHGGDIRVSSAPGHGCSFRVNLPLAPP